MCPLCKLEMPIALTVCLLFQAKKIAKNGQKFMQENLMPRDIFCYHAAFFKVGAPFVMLRKHCDFVGYHT